MPSGGGSGIVKQFGNPADGDIPLAGDYDGDGKTDIAVYDPVAKEFLVLTSSSNYTTPITMYLPATLPTTDFYIPLIGNFEGNGITDFVIFDRTTSTFYVYRPDGTLIRVQQLGIAGHNNVGL